MVKRNKVISVVLKSNFVGWIVNYKIYIVVILLLIFSLDNYTNVFIFAKEVGYRVTPFFFPFLFTHPFMHLVIFTSIIFLFSNAPFVNSLQLLMMSRSGKRIWYLSQMIYLVICTIIMTLFLLILPIVRNFNMIALTSEWGKVWTTLSTGVGDMVNPASYFVINRYSPCQAMMYTITMFILICVFIGMILMFCNTVFQNNSIGIVVSSALVILDWMSDITGASGILWISPISWISISKMAYARDTSAPSIGYGFVVLAVLDFILMIWTYIWAKKQDIAVIADET